MIHVPEKCPSTYLNIYPLPDLISQVTLFPVFKVALIALFVHFKPKKSLWSGGQSLASILSRSWLQWLPLLQKYSTSSQLRFSGSNSAEKLSSNGKSSFEIVSFSSDKHSSSSSSVASSRGP